MRTYNYLFLLTLAAGLGVGCETTKPTASAPLFNDEKRADLIVRYYSDSTSFMIKPSKLDGAFRCAFSSDDVLGIAKAQPGRDLAVIVIDPYPNKKDMDVMKAKWRQSLAELGYHRLVILRSGIGMKVNRLRVIENIETATPMASITPKS